MKKKFGIYREDIKDGNETRTWNIYKYQDQGLKKTSNRESASKAYESGNIEWVRVALGMGWGEYHPPSIVVILNVLITDGTSLAWLRLHGS